MTLLKKFLARTTKKSFQAWVGSILRAILQSGDWTPTRPRGAKGRLVYANSKLRKDLTKQLGWA